ncbi:MAG: ribosome-associated translation inhibitor RaiA [Gaiellales bacterium]
MELELKVRRGAVNDSIRATVAKKLQRLDRKLADAVELQVTLDREQNPRIADDHLVEGEVRYKSLRVHAKAAGPTYEIAADRLVDALDRQIDRHREKKIREPRRRIAQPDAQSG